MVFNWFERFENKQDEAAAEPAPVQPEPAELSAVSESATPAQGPNQDLLNFARAAYKNIQQKEKEKPVETTLAVEPEVAVAVPETPEAAAELIIQSPEPQSLVPVSEPEPESTEFACPRAEPEPELAEPLPFWAKAEVDRQERLERLRATALEEPEPELAAAVAEPGQSDLPFDAGFLWSAEVLAAEGRKAEDISIEEITWLKRLRHGLEKTRRNLVNQLKALVGQGPLNADAVEDIETLLLQADSGVAATDRIIKALQARLRQEALPPEQAIAYLKQLLRDMLELPFQVGYSPRFAPTKDTLNIWLITGVNGAGKTTTIGKIAHIAHQSGYKTLIAAGDTFRAAAVAQVQVWGERAGVEVIANPGKNTDPAAVVFDAITAAQARDCELLLIDTAGRLQNKKNLMDELSKIRRIIDKKAPDAVVESLLVLDSTLGQNGLQQAKVFAEVAKLSGVVLTKLDGTARGGVALAVVEQLSLPIRFIGAGEGIEDLRPFSSYEFVEALLSD